MTDDSALVEAFFRFNLHQDNADELRSLLCHASDASSIGQKLSLKHGQALLFCLESGQIDEAEKHLPYVTKLLDLLDGASPRAAEWIIGKMTILQFNEGLLLAATQDNVNMVSHLVAHANNHNDSFLAACRNGSANCLPILLHYIKSTTENPEQFHQMVAQGVFATIEADHFEAFRLLFLHEVGAGAEKNPVFVRGCLNAASLYNSVKILQLVVPFAVLCTWQLIDFRSSIQVQILLMKTYFFVEACEIARHHGAIEALIILTPCLLTV